MIRKALKRGYSVRLTHVIRALLGRPRGHVGTRFVGSDVVIRHEPYFGDNDEIVAGVEYVYNGETLVTKYSYGSIGEYGKYEAMELAKEKAREITEIE